DQRLCAVRLSGLGRFGLRRIGTRQRLRTLVEVAARAPHRANLIQRRRLGSATVLDETTAAGEDAAAGGLTRPGEETGDGVQCLTMLVGVAARDAPQQAHGVRVTRVVEDVERGPLL